MDLDVALKIRADARQMAAELRRGAEKLDRFAGKAGREARRMAAATDRAAKSVAGLGGSSALSASRLSAMAASAIGV